MIRAIRVLLVALGVGIGLFGAKLLLDLGTDNLVATLKWFVAGVVIHDGIIGPATIAVCYVAVRIGRGRVPGAVIIGGIVLSTVTIAAIPMLGRFGARPDNATLLPRNYTVGWLVFAGLTLVFVILALLRERHRPKGVAGGTSSGG
jgi:hypothetical protein